MMSDQCENCVMLTVENLKLSNANIDARLFHSKEQKEWKEIATQLIELAKELNARACQVCQERRERDEVEDSNGSSSED